MIKKNPHKNLYKQRLHVKKIFLKFLNSIKLFVLFSTEISSTEMSRSRDVLIPSGKRDAFIERRRFTDNLKKKERNKLEKIQAIQTNTGSRTQYISRGIFKIYIYIVDLI